MANTNFKPGLEGTGESFTNLPVFDTPFTRIAENWCTDQNTQCRDYEMDFVRCQAKIGMKKSQTNEMCLRYWDDYAECRYKLKTRKRYMAMLEERKKQDRPKLETPPLDSIFTNIEVD